MLGIKLCRGSALLALQRVDIERYLYADRSSETFVPVVSPTCVAWAWAPGDRSAWAKGDMVPLLRRPGKGRKAGQAQFKKMRVEFVRGNLRGHT